MTVKKPYVQAIFTFLILVDTAYLIWFNFFLLDSKRDEIISGETISGSDYGKSALMAVNWFLPIGFMLLVISPLIRMPRLDLRIANSLLFGGFVAISTVTIFNTMLFFERALPGVEWARNVWWWSSELARW